MSNPDYIAVDIRNNHIVSVTEETYLETPDEDVASYVSRGVYSFTNYKKARHFKTIVNQSVENEIAFLFSREPMENEE